MLAERASVSFGGFRHTAGRRACEEGRGLRAQGPGGAWRPPAGAGTVLLLAAVSTALWHCALAPPPRRYDAMMDEYLEESYRSFKQRQVRVACFIY